jgi:dienelactone hydrolase
MTRQWLSAVLTLAVIGLVRQSEAAEPAPPDARAASAAQFVQNIVTAKYADAASCFDTAMAQAMSPERLKQMSSSLIQQCGAFRETGETRSAQEAGFQVVFVACKFEKQTLDAEVVFDKDGKIGGLWFGPHIESRQSQYSTPDYVRPNLFDEREVTVGAGEWKLPATLALPKGEGPFPALVLVHGSGPNDRDETIGANKPFRDLALGLASRGIAVLRYDKRTKVYAAQMAASKDTWTVKQEVLDDAMTAVALLRNTPKIAPTRIFVLGHSLGGTLIPRIGKLDEHLAGLIVMAGTTRPLEDVILEQTEYLSSLNGAPSVETQKYLAEIQRQVAAVKSLALSADTPASTLLFGAPPSYWLDLRGYAPAELAKTLSQPLLILQGGRDYQATKADYEGWAKSLADRPRVTFKLYPDLDHLFMEGTGKSTPAEYDKREPVARKVIDDIAAWIATQ